MKNKITTVIDFLKTAAIYLLTISMLTTAGLYINARQNAGQTEKIPWEKKRAIEIGGTVLSDIEINENHINPIQITVTAGGKSFAVAPIYNDKLILDVYENFKSDVIGLFGRNSDCRRFEKEEGEKLWEECTQRQNSVYIKYPGNYIYPVVCAFIDEMWDIKNERDAFSGQDRELAMVRELFIVDKDPVYGVTKDENGNVSVFTPEAGTGDIIKENINAANLSAYNNTAGAIPCEFLKDDDISAKTGVNSNNIKNLKLPADFHLFYNYGAYSSVLNFSNPLADENGRINVEQDFIKNLFKTFNFNTESSAYYSNSNGITFVDGKNTVGFYKDGRIIYEYKSSDSNQNMLKGEDETGGIHLTKFLGYDADYYTSYEKIKAASVFVNSLDKELTGNDCDIYLKSVISNSDEDDEELEVIFCYYYGGIKLKFDKKTDEAIAIKIGRKSVTEVKIKSLSAVLSTSLQSSTVKNKNPVLILSVIDDLISGEINKTEETEITETTDAKTKEDIAKEYNLKYDKTRDKFIVSEFELVYNIDYVNYTEKNNDSVKPEWEIIK